MFPNFQFIMGMAILLQWNKIIRIIRILGTEYFKEEFYFFLKVSRLYTKYCYNRRKLHFFFFRIPGSLEGTGISFIFISALHLLIKETRILRAILSSFIAIYLGF
jgi:hypothetical protein